MTKNALSCAALVMMVAATAACGSEASSAPPVTPQPSVPPSIDTPPLTTEVPAPTSATGACVVHQDAFRVALASATGTCATNDDCGCYNPVIAEAGCGGITDAATASRLRAIEDAWRSDGCQWPHQCGPWSCEPVCREGRCVNAGQIDPSTL